MTGAGTTANSLGRRTADASAVPLKARGRRAFLRSGTGLAAMTALASAGLGASGALQADIYEPDRRITLINDHLGEHVDIVYFENGHYVENALTQINEVMRDRRADESCAMDRYLIDDLVRLHRMFNTSEPLHLLSGYRTAKTNAMLRKRSSGVAKYSLHMEGRAADIHLPGVPTEELQLAALSMKSGGVGYYKRSGFVHIDTGGIRNWGRI